MWGGGGVWGVDRGWMPLPTRPRRYCNPVLLVVSSYSKYQSFRFICHPNKNSPVFPSRRHPLYIEMDGTSMASFSRVLRDSTPSFVHLSVGLSHFTFLMFLRFLASLLLPKCSSDPKYGPCPPARVSGLLLEKTFT